MGMDYIGRNGNLHLNWTLHSFMYGLLENLGCDLDEWSGSNDGDPIREKVCQEWGKALREALDADRIRQVTVPSEDYTGGEVHIPFIVGCNPEEVAKEFFRVTLAIGSYRQEGEAYYQVYPEGNPNKGKLMADFGKLQVGDIPDWMRSTLTEVAEFFATCGGCEQC